MIYILPPHPGCSLVAKAPALGAGDRRFESFYPDNRFYNLLVSLSSA